MSLTEKWPEIKDFPDSKNDESIRCLTKKLTLGPGNPLAWGGVERWFGHVLTQPQMLFVHENVNKAIKMVYRFVVICSFLLCLSSSSFGALVINLTQSGANDVVISVSGSGTVTAGGNNPGSVIDFQDFGSPWNSSVDAIFSLTPNNTISLGPATYSQVALDIVGGSRFDFDFRSGSSSINNGDDFLGSGTATIVGLSFANLTPGTYTSTIADTNGNDADNFGGVTLNIVAVPEPSSVASFVLVGGILAGRRRRRIFDGN
ncbi:hypothetical protein LF1_25910 [Rubripirellula obstinata]|uniref:PEP-CTERM protein-sorting domain-containing protein n=1 Tax=Rubripirellula obstinata TaxID=406547 RepID=A0A5B1CIG9_9BACT|nr:PEP-CTERM sorting domain-containing protein [Rubripirellula obstinata]KAA1260052.1 hypothetical protein LF1_25910 [Rubripirellula obstinata]